MILGADGAWAAASNAGAARGRRRPHCAGDAIGETGLIAFGCYELAGAGVDAEGVGVGVGCYELAGSGVDVADQGDNHRGDEVGRAAADGAGAAGDEGAAHSAMQHRRRDEFTRCESARHEPKTEQSACDR